MRFINASSDHVRVPDFGIDCAPGEECDVLDTHARPRRASNDSRLPSTIEMRAPQLVPADEAERVEWLKVPPRAERRSVGPRSRVEQLRDAGATQGVAEVQAAVEEAKATGGPLELTAAEAAALAPKRGPGRPRGKASA